MKVSDLMADLETGDRTMEHLKEPVVEGSVLGGAGSMVGMTMTNMRDYADAMRFGQSQFASNSLTNLLGRFK